MRVGRTVSVLVLFLVFPVLAQQVSYPTGDARLAAFERQNGRGWVVRWSEDRQRVVSILGGRTKPYPGAPAEAARQFLREYAALFGLRPDVADLRVSYERRHLGGGSAELQQTYESLPVENARIQVNLDKRNRVLQVTSSYLPNPRPPAPATLTREAAASAAIDAFLKTTPATTPPREGAKPPHATKIDDVVFVKDGALVRAYRIDVAADVPYGIKQFVIDARTGAVLRMRDSVHGADGTGQVFIPNPNASLNDYTLSEATVPNSNPNPYYTVPLLSLNPAGGDGLFRLQGPFVSVQDLVGPANVPAAESSADDFIYTRGGTEFVDVMAYYHIDRMQRYIQSLGFVDVNNRPVAFDSDDGSDGAWYSNDPKGLGVIKFGSRAGHPVGEDAEAIMHEYGHAVQANQTTDKYDTAGDPNNMGEGFADYLGFSAYEAEVTAAGDDPGCFAEWVTDTDGCLRRVDLNLTMDDYVAPTSPYDNCQIWSRTLFDIFNTLGKMTADRLIIQSHFNVPDSPSFKDGADAIMTADLQLYAGTHLPQLCTVFMDRKIYAAADCPSVPAPAGTQNTLVVLAKFSGLAGEPIDAGGVTTRVNAINDYLGEITYGQASLTPTTQGWIQLPGTRDQYYDQTSNSLLVDLVDDVIAALPATDFTLFDRMIVITNDDGSGGETRGMKEWATTGPWPYTLPAAFGTKRMSVSVHRSDQTGAQFNHAIGHHFGLIDLYEHESVSFPRRYVNGWTNMGQNADRTAFPNTHVLAWEKSRPPWTGNVHWIPFPGPGGSATQNDIQLFRQEVTGNPVAIQIGTTPGVTNREDEKVSYWIEARRQEGTFDNNIPADGVVVYYVNEHIAQGFGPTRLVDATPGDDDLTNAMLHPGGTASVSNIDSTGLNVTVKPNTGSEEYRVDISYNPPPDTVDVWINPHDGYWRSPDIWIDNESCKDGNCGFDGVGNARDPMDRGDNPIAGTENRVYARIYNHSGTAHDVRVDFWFSDPYHAADGGAFDPDTGGNIAFNKHDFRIIDNLSSDPDGELVWVSWTPEPPPGGGGVHACVKVKIQPVFNDTNAFNQASQENIQEYDIAMGSPYPPVEDPIKVVNPYDKPILVFLRADNVPQGWTATIAPAKAFLPVGGSIDALMTVQAPQDYPVCTTEYVTATAWYASGDTLVPLGGSTAQVNLTQSTQLTVTSEFEECRYHKYSTVGLAGNDDCGGIVTKGCTNPPRPNEHITIRYTAPDGTTVYHDVVTDANGCFEDFYVAPQGGPWSVDTELQGGDCLQPSGGKPGTVFVPPGAGRPLDPSRFWYSFHLGMSFPIGSFDNSHDPGPSVTFDLEYPWTEKSSLVLLAGYHQFPGSGGVPDAGIANLNFDYRRYFPIGTVTGFWEIGPGLYGSSSTWGWGANAGTGLSFPVLPKLTIEPAIDLHYASRQRRMFFDTRLGIAWRF